jgi:hypothetical protein
MFLRYWVLNDESMTFQNEFEISCALEAAMDADTEAVAELTASGGMFDTVGDVLGAKIMGRYHAIMLFRQQKRLHQAAQIYVVVLRFLHLFVVWFAGNDLCCRFVALDVLRANYNIYVCRFAIYDLLSSCLKTKQYMLSLCGFCILCRGFIPCNVFRLVVMMLGY